MKRVAIVAGVVGVIGMNLPRWVMLVAFVVTVLLIVAVVLLVRSRPLPPNEWSDDGRGFVPGGTDYITPDPMLEAAPMRVADVRADNLPRGEIGGAR